MFLELDRVFDAVQAAEKAILLSPDWGPALLTWSRSLFEFGEIEKAREAATRALVAGEEEAAEISDAADRILADARQGRAILVNNRIIALPFWETARAVTYDAEGRPVVEEKDSLKAPER